MEKIREKELLGTEKIIKDMSTEMLGLKIVVCAVFGFCLLFMVMLSLTMRGLGFDGMPFVAALILGFTISYMIKKTQKHADAIRSGDFELIEDVVTRKFKTTDRDSDGNATTHYRLIGEQCGRQIPAISSYSIWNRIQPGDIVWVLKRKEGKNEWFLKTYSSVQYELSDELSAKVMRSGETEKDEEKTWRMPQPFEMEEDEATDMFHANQDDVDAAIERDRRGRRIVKCTSCGRRFNAETSGGTCPHCGAMQVY